MYTTVIFKMDKQQGPTIQHMELYLTLWARLDGSGVAVGRMDTHTHTHTHIWLSSYSIHLKLPQHC